MHRTQSDAPPPPQMDGSLPLRWTPKPLKPSFPRMAVGPKVIIPDFGDNDYNWGEKFAGKGIFDIVVKDANGNTFYIPGAIGDTKNHTYNNGIIQTYIAYNDGYFQKGSFSSAYGNFNGTVAAEFIGNLSVEKLAPLYNYYIDSIRFYPA